MSDSNVFTQVLTASSSYITSIWTNFGPLTTVYTPPTKCQSEAVNQGLVVFSITVASNSTAVSYDCAQGRSGYIENAACYPSSSAVQHFADTPTTALAGGYWSPGGFCPSAWSTAYSKTFAPAPSSSSIGGFVNAEQSMIGNRSMGATFVECCPSAYTYNGVCVSQITTTTSGAMCDINYSCSTSSGIAGSVCASNAQVFTWDPQETATAVFVTAYPINMMQQDSDLASSSTTIPGALSTLSTHKSQSTGSVQGGGNGGEQQGGSSTSGAKVIVPAVVVPVVALIAFVAAVIFCLRARKQRARRRAEGSYAPNQWEKNSTPDASADNGDRAYS